MNRGGSNDGRFSGLFVVLGARHADFCARVTGKGHEECAVVFFDGRDPGSGLFQIFMQLERISLDGEIQIANGKTADDVPDRPAGQVEIQTGGTGDLLYQVDALELIRRQPEFHRVNVISHSRSSGLGADFRTAIEPTAIKPARAGRTGLSTGFPQIRALSYVSPARQSASVSITRT